VNVYPLLFISVFLFLLFLLLLIYAFLEFRKLKIVKGILLSLSSLISLMLAFMLLFFFQSLKTYQILTREDLVAKIYAKEITKDTMMVTLEYSREPSKNFFYVIIGENWEIQGVVVKWKTYLEFLGIHTAYKITRLKGRYSSVENVSPTSYQLAEEDFLTQLIMKHGQKIFFVDAVFGQGIFQYPDNKPFYLYVTEDGFMLRKK